MWNDERRVEKREFPMAKMSRPIRILTAFLIFLPVVMIGCTLFTRMLALPAFILTLLYIGVWLFYRPATFVVTAQTIEIVWPLRRRRIDRAGILSSRVVDGRQLKEELGWCMRIGVGGLWGGFGWLWTQKRGIVQMYISRADELVWLERGKDRPYLISPANPEQFVQALFPPGRSR